MDESKSAPAGPYDSWAGPAGITMRWMGCGGVAILLVLVFHGLLEQDWGEKGETRDH